MKYDWIDKYLLEKPGVTKDLLNKAYGIVLGSLSKKKKRRYWKMSDLILFRDMSDESIIDFYREITI